MKKTAFILVICLIFMSMQNFALAEENIYKETLRVGLAYGNSAVSEVRLYSESPIDVIDANYLSYITTIPANTEFKVTVYGGVMTSDYFSPVSSALYFESGDVIYYNNSGYHGSFEIRCDSERMNVINIVNLEDYLASLLGREMSSSWPIEALKAQAVCARNYALTIAGKHSSYGFDVCATTDCQVYGGIKSEADRTRQAVEETRGVMVTYKGKVVPLYYFSCDGGYTEDSENVWISAEGYLRGKQDIHESPKHATLYNWSKTMTKSEIEDILISKNINIGELTDIRIDELSDNNGVIKLTFVGTEGEKTVTKTQTRTTLSLNSQAYTIEKHVDGAEPEMKEEIITQHVLTANGVVSVNNPAYAITGGGIAQIPYAMVEEETEAEYYDSYTFNGHGWGHLVGMSQWGAYSMALKGYTYKDILSFYYTDIIIEENWYTVPDTETEPVEEETEEVPAEHEEIPEEVTEPTEAETETQSNEYDETQWSDTGI